MLANVAKLGAVTFFAFWFLHLFEELVLLVIVALIVPFVDAYSVFRGPTGNIVEHHSNVFTYFSVYWALPHERNDPRLGHPRRPLLRPLPGGGRPLPASPRLDVAGDGRGPRRDGRDHGLGRRRRAPALPALSVGFLVPNADLIWAQLAQAERGRPR